MREGLAELELDRGFSEDATTFGMHPALLDLATGCALYLIDGYLQSSDLYLPLAYKRLSVYSRIPSKLWSHIRSRQENSVRRDVAVFDITLFDEQDQVLAEIEAFTMRRLADPAKARTPKAPPSSAALPEDEQSIEALGNTGIVPLEGARVLTRILMTTTPHTVVVTAQPIDDLETQDPVARPRAMHVAAPREEVASTIADWWRELLGVEQIGLDDDFFDLGGQSLVAIRLITRIKKTYQVDLDLAVLFEARTVRQLADVIRNAKQPAAGETKAWSALVPIQASGSRIPFFSVHHLGTGVLFYDQLAKLLGPDQPFYAFQSPLESDDRIRETSVEELASIYVKELRRFLPNGPYLLGGASLGGIIALEMSQQLLALGAKTDLLIMFDASVPGSERHVAALEQTSTFWRKFRRQGVPYLKNKIEIKADYLKLQLRQQREAIACSIYRLAGQSLPTALRYAQAIAAHRRTLEKYTAKPYLGKITLIRTTDFRETLSAIPDPNMGWDKFAGGGLEIHDVPGGHISMFAEPNVLVLAETLTAILSTHVAE